MVYLKKAYIFPQCRQVNRETTVGNISH